MKNWSKNIFIKSIWGNIGLIVTIFFGIAYFLLQYHKYLQFEYFYVDNVYFFTAIDKLANGQIPIVWHQWWGEMNIFGDHFHPILFFVAFFWKIAPTPVTLFALTSVFVALGGLYGYKICQKLDFHKLISVALLVAYFCYLGLQNAFLFGFHENIFVGAWLLGMLWAHLEKRQISYWFFLLLLLLTKETMGFFGVFMGLYIISKRNKNERIQGLVTIILSILYSYLVLKIIIPYISGGPYRYSYTDYPDTFLDFFKQITTPNVKIQTFFISLLTFVFLPFGSILGALLIIYEFLTRFLIEIAGNVQDSLYYHYGFQTGVVLYLSAILGFENISKKISKLRLKNNQKIKNLAPFIFGLVIVLTVIVLHRFSLTQRGPIELVFRKEFYQNSRNNKYLFELIENVPKTNGDINAMNHLGLALVGKGKQIYMLAHKIEPNLICSTKNQNTAKYLVMDLRQGQNPNNYFNSDEERTRLLIKKLLENRIYKIYWSKADMMILELNNKLENL